MTKKLPGGMTFTEIETSRPAMEGAVDQTYGILFARGFQVHAIRMRDTYYVTDHMSLAGLERIRFLKHLTRVKIVAFHNLAQSGYAYVYSDMAQEAMSMTEADQLNAMRELLLQSERHPQGPGFWEKAKAVNKVAGDNAFTKSLLEMSQGFEDLLTARNLDDFGDALYDIVAKPWVNVGRFFEGLF